MIVERVRASVLDRPSIEAGERGVNLQKVALHKVMQGSVPTPGRQPAPLLLI